MTWSSACLPILDLWLCPKPCRLPGFLVQRNEMAGKSKVESEGWQSAFDEFLIALVSQAPCRETSASFTRTGWRPGRASPHPCAALTEPIRLPGPEQASLSAVFLLQIILAKRGKDQSLSAADRSSRPTTKIHQKMFMQIS